MMTTLPTAFTRNPFNGASLEYQNYTRFSGTSASAPVVTGVMALLQARAKSALKRFLLPNELRWLVMSTATQTPDLFGQIGAGVRGEMPVSGGCLSLGDACQARIVSTSACGMVGVAMIPTVCSPQGKLNAGSAMQRLNGMTMLACGQTWLMPACSLYM